jgi:predicted secreted protein
MAKYAAKGAAIAYLSGTTYVPIAQVAEISYDLGGVADKVDVTTHDTVGNYREFVSTWLQTGRVDLTVVYDPGIASHAWLRTQGGNSKTFRITLPDTGDATETFTGTLGALNVSAGVDGRLEATVGIEIEGASSHAA